MFCIVTMVCEKNGSKSTAIRRMTYVALTVNSGNCVNSAQMLQGKFHIQNTVLPLARSLHGASYENQDPVKCKQFTTTYCAIWVHSYFLTKNSSPRVKCRYLVSNCMKIKPCTFNCESVSIANSTNQASSCMYVLQYTVWIRRQTQQTLLIKQCNKISTNLHGIYVIYKQNQDKTFTKLEGKVQFKAPA
jgi:hypothetical protein